MNLVDESICVPRGMDYDLDGWSLNQMERSIHLRKHVSYCIDIHVHIRVCVKWVRKQVIGDRRSVRRSAVVATPLTIE